MAKAPAHIWRGAAGNARARASVAAVQRRALRATFARTVDDRTVCREPG